MLNLGVEGMMLVGAVTGFAVTSTTGSRIARHRRRGAGRRGRWPLIFGFLTLTLVANQVATGLALTIFGIGLSSLIGAGFVGTPIAPLLELAIPGLRWPASGAAAVALRPGRRSSISRSLLTVGVAWFLKRTRAGLILRAVRRERRLGPFDRLLR